MHANRPLSQRVHETLSRRSPTFILGSPALDKAFEPTTFWWSVVAFATRSDRAARRYWHRRAVSLTFDYEELEYWDMTGRDLSGLRITRGNMAGIGLRDTDLSSSHLFAANFECADLRGARLWRCDLRSANFVSADLTGVDLRRARLEGTDFRFAHLVAADLTTSRLTGADLSGADLRGAKFDEDFDRSAVISNEQTRWPDSVDA